MINDDEILAVFNSVFRSKYTSLDIEKNSIRNWDSMKHAELIIKLQKKFNITFKATDVGKINNVLDIKSLLSALIEVN